MSSESDSTSVRKPIFGWLSVATPFIGGFAYYVFMDAILNAYSPIPVFLTASTPIWGILLAAISWMCGERPRVLLWIGLILNSGILVVLIYGFTHLRFGC
jgi:hypothetical protein